MANSIDFRNSVLTLVGDEWRVFSLHTGDPGTTGANEVAGGGYARQTTTWSPAASGSRTGSEVVFPVPAGTTVTHAAQRRSDGTFGRGVALPAPETYGGNGVYRLTPTMTSP